MEYNSSSCENLPIISSTPVPSDILLKALLVGYPFLFIVGIIGNALSFLVLHPFGTRISGHVYLACLAVFDTLSLFFYVLSFWSVMILRPFLINMKNEVAVRYIDHYLSTAGICEIRIYLTFTMRMLSVWTVVILTMERFLLIVSPLRFYKFLRPKVAWITMSVTCVLIGAINLPWIFSFSYVSAPTCTQTSMKRCVAGAFFQHCRLTEFVLITIVPAILLLMANILIALTLARRRQLWISPQQSLQKCLLTKAHRHQKGHMEDAPFISDGAVAKCHADAQRNERQLTLRLFLVSLTFCILSLPSVVFVSIHTFAEYQRASYHRHGPLADAFHISLFLFAVNLTINFVIYCVIGKTFRRALWALIICDLSLFRFLRTALISGTEITSELIEVTAKEKKIAIYSEDHFRSISSPIQTSKVIANDLEARLKDIPYVDS